MVVAKIFKNLILVLGHWALMLFGANAEPLQIIDGDTLKLGSTSFRLNVIYAPEYGQKCNRSGGGTWPCGK